MTLRKPDKQQWVNVLASINKVYSSSVALVTTSGPVRLSKDRQRVKLNHDKENYSYILALTEKNSKISHNRATVQAKTQVPTLILLNCHSTAIHPKGLYSSFSWLALYITVGGRLVSQSSSCALTLRFILYVVTRPFLVEWLPPLLLILFHFF